MWFTAWKYFRKQFSAQISQSIWTSNKTNFNAISTIYFAWYIIYTVFFFVIYQPHTQCNVSGLHMQITTLLFGIFVNQGF